MAGRERGRSSSLRVCDGVASRRKPLVLSPFAQRRLVPAPVAVLSLSGPRGLSSLSLACSLPPPVIAASSVFWEDVNDQGVKTPGVGVDAYWWLAPPIETVGVSSGYTTQDNVSSVYTGVHLQEQFSCSAVSWTKELDSSGLQSSFHSGTQDSGRLSGLPSANRAVQQSAASFALRGC
ncbi:unnamed protein product [Arctogadus glacialis]